MSESRDNLPILLCEHTDDLIKWIESNPKADGVWLKFAKKGTGVTSINYQQALDVALCYGWIDSVVNKYDETFYLQKFTPRRARSVWSVRNREKAEAFIAEGKMQPAGLAEIEKAKKDGRWNAAYASSANAEMPADFLAALEKRPAAKEFFETLSKSNRYAIYYRLHTAKRPETRQRRFDQIIEMLENGQKFH